MRLFSLTNTHTSRRYGQAVQDVFGVSCNLDDYQVNRGWYHIQVPKVTVQRLFRTDTIMTFKIPSGFTLNARTHDQQAEPYRQYIRPGSSGDWADQYDRPADTGNKQVYPISTGQSATPEYMSYQAPCVGTHWQSWY